MRDALKEDFAAGLWNKGLVEQLGWRVASDAAQRPSDLNDFPSWSWMSVMGGIEVGSRIGHSVRAWVVEGDEGNELHFRLKHRFTAVTLAGMEPKWEEELQSMQDLMDGVNEKRAAHAERTPPSPKATDANSADTEEDPRVKEARLAKQASDAIQKKRDELPQLESEEIVIKSHVMKGVLKKPHDTKNWTLSVQTAASPVAMEAFPDVTTMQEDEKKRTFVKPVTDNSECEFVILAMSCLAYQTGRKRPVDRNQFGSFEDDELASLGAEFEGNGILVEKGKGDTYTRIGAMAFRGLNKEAWDCLRESCCGRGTGNGVHALDDGIRIELH